MDGEALPAGSSRETRFEAMTVWKIQLRRFSRLRRSRIGVVKHCRQYACSRWSMSPEQDNSGRVVRPYSEDVDLCLVVGLWQACEGSRVKLDIARIAVVIN